MKTNLKIITTVLALLMLPLTINAMEMDDCMGCHSEADEVGDELVIDGDAFAHTVHAEMGCVTCHESITDEHPDDGEPVTSAKCLECHEEVHDEYMTTSHAENATCTDCHNPHQVRGLETVSGANMNQQCSECHENSDVLETHSTWLPQAGLHVAKIPCITCHTATDSYEVVLNITEKKNTSTDNEDASKFPSYADLKSYSGEKDIQTLIDINEDNHISLAELRTFNLNPAYKNLLLAGTLVPTDASHNLSSLDNRYDCTFCHAAGPGSMQTSFLALPTAEGSYSRMTVDEGAMLDTLYGTPNFYMTGSSRSASMNIIGLLIICGGFIMPIGHGTLRYLTRKNRQH